MHGSPTREEAFFSSIIDRIKLLITGHDNLHLGHILNVHVPSLVEAGTGEEIGKQGAACPTLISEGVSTIITTQINMGKYMKNRGPVAQAVQQGEVLQPKIRMASQFIRGGGGG